MIVFVIGFIIVVSLLVRWDYRRAVARQNAFNKRKQEILLPCVRRHVEKETKEQLVNRLVKIAGNLPSWRLESLCRAIQEDSTKTPLI